MRHLSLAVLLAAVLTGCGPLAHENAFDPQTPASDQAKTTLAGTVTLEAVGGVTPSLAGIQVILDDGASTTSTNTTGGYLFRDVPAGVHSVQAIATNYDPATLAGVTTTIDMGGRIVPLPTLSLQRVRADLAGTVQLNLPTAADPGALNPATENTGGANVGVDVPAGPGGPAPLHLAARLPSRSATSGGGTAVTDSSGDFLIPDLPAPVGSYTLTASKYGYVTTTSTVTFSGGTFVVQTVQLETQPGAVSGRVIVPGAPANTDVTVRARGATAGGTPWEDAIPVPLATGGVGTFLFSGLPAGSYEISFHLVDYGTVSTAAAVNPGGVTAIADAELVRLTGGAKGTVLLSGSPSHAGAVVTLTGTQGTWSAVTGADGAFALAALPVGRYSVTIGKDPDWQGQVAADVDVLANATATLTGSPFTLQPRATASIAGTVLLEGGADPRTISVSLSGLDFLGRAVGTSTSPTTTGGAYSFPGLLAGTYQLSFVQSGYETPPPVGTSVATGQSVALGPLALAASRGDVTGIVDAAGTSADAGTVVTVSGGPDTGSAVTDATGRWRANGLRVGPGYTATYVRPGYATATSSPFSITASGLFDLGTADLSVATTGALSGVAKVQRPAGADGSIAVALTGSDLNGNAVTRATATDGAGGWSIGSLPQGTYKLTFSKAYYDVQVASGVALATGGSVTVATVTLPVSLGTIAGQATLSKGTASNFTQGTDYSGIVVTLSGLDAGVSLPAAVTDATGTFRFDGVPVSTSGSAYTVTAQATNYVSAAGSVTAAPNGSAAVVPSSMTLDLNVGSLTTTVAVNDTGTPGIPTSGTVTVSLTGSAFNATSFSASVDNSGAAADLPDIPPGTYQVVATSTNRACGGPVNVTVSPGAASAIATPFTCTDAVAPGPVALGVPQGAGAQPGFTSATSARVPITGFATDGSLNLRGYQYVAGVTPNWSSPPVDTSGNAYVDFPAGTLNADGTWTLWVRAVDRVGNVGPASSVQVVRDQQRPGDVVINTPRRVVNATSTTAILTGGTDANFLTYRWCMLPTGPTSFCPTPCTPTDSAASIAITFDAADRKACVWAQARDKAGNASLNLTAIELLSDLSAPTPPSFVPSFDPYVMKVRAPWVDFFLYAASTDAPAGGGSPWAGVSHIEVDTGSGFAPLCPDAACHASGGWAPCGCCSDPMLLCDGTDFLGVRAPLSEGVATTVAFRSVDLAGNVGPGVSQQVFADSTSEIVSATSESEMYPLVLGSLVGFSVRFDGWLVDLGSNRRADATDPRCKVGSSVATGLWAPVAPVNAGLVAFVEGSLKIRRAGAAGWCSTDTTTTIRSPGANQWIDDGIGSGETLLFVERTKVVTNPGPPEVYYYAYAIRAREPGPDGKVGTADEAGPDAVVGTADDFHTGTIGTYGSINKLYMGGRTALTNLDPCSPLPCTGTAGWKIIDATAVSAFYSGATFSDLPATAGAAGISRDGREVAWVEGTNLKLRLPGPNGRFDSGGDDVVHTRPIPPGLSLTSLAVDGPHVVGGSSVSGANPVSWLVHWWAGPDSTWGTTDDVVETLQPSSIAPYTLALSGGLATLQLGNDIVAVDLSTRRWEVVPTTTLPSASGIPSVFRTNGAGTIFYRLWNGPVLSRTPDGIERTGPSHNFMEAEGGNLLTTDQKDVWVYNPGATTGRFFDADQPASARIYTGVLASGVKGMRVGGGKAIVAAELVSGTSSFRIFEPLAGTLHDVAATGRVVDPGLTMNTNWMTAVGITARQAFFACNGINWRLCVWNAGADNEFGGSGDSYTYMVHPANSTVPGQAFGVYGYTPKAEVNDDLMIISERSGASTVATYLIWAGPDHLFNTADDVERKLADTENYQQTMEVRGTWAAFLDDAPPGGLQLHVVNGFDGAIQVATDYWSPKRALVLEPTGRTYWIDGVLAPEGIMVWSP